MKVSGGTKAEVIAKLKEVHRSLDAGVESPTSRLTVGTFLDRWVEGVPGRVEQSTAADYADTVRLHLKPALGSKVLTKLSVSELNALWASKRKAGYSANSIRIMRTVLRSALHQAEREGLLVRNVAALSDPPRVGHSEGRSLTIAEAKILLDAASADRLEALYAISLTLGLRRGEALGLSWSDIDLESALVRVRRQLRRERLPEEDRVDGGRRTQLVIRDLKTKRSRRTLHLTPALDGLLRTHRARQAREQLAAGPAWIESDLVFTTKKGTPIDPDNFAHYFHRLCARAGLGHWTPHELRHSAASIMLAQGTPLWVVSEVLGHASVAITKDVYGHLIGGEKQEATEAITDVLFRSPQPPDGRTHDQGA
ncbi:MAG: site-specific integrase [Acidimicrobiia bacterium]|nr:site-specific integrase [Acidimicrobiia bacterium]MBT8194267.1 site-specific integrase [Acidimicrobiia bacterium]MBT8247585.1 site-specific integrase [Acidimicrobiia bacterium]NNJ47675.1 site-specific integrase [Acidimicrobiia bacterium]